MTSRKILGFLYPLLPLVRHSRNLSVLFVTPWVTPDVTSFMDSPLQNAFTPVFTIFTASRSQFDSTTLRTS